MKLSLLTIKSNLNKLYNSSEGAARGAVATWMKNEDEKLIKFHSYLLTQCVIQFATQKLVKKNSLIHKANYSEIRKLLSVISIENIKLIDHDAKHLAITASKLLLREQDYGTGLMIWMVDQMESISNFPKKESWKLIPEISDWLDTAFLKCESTIKKTTFKDESFQEDLFYKNAKEAGKDGIPSGKRNIKK